MSWWQKIRLTPFNRLFAITLLVVMSVQLVPIEGYEISPVKVLMMGFCVIVFVCKVPYISNALIFATLYWLVCFCISILWPGFRFSTLAYSGLFLMTFVAYHNIVYTGAFSLKQFQKVLRTIIIAYAVVLVAQQVCVLLGLRNFPVLNLVGAGYYQWNRLPVLTCEPSHSATILTGLFIGYLRCVELLNGSKPMISVLFSVEHRKVVLCYLWLILTMGSGTGWIGFGIVCLYFIQWRTVLYVIPLLLGGFLVLQNSENEQFHRALTAVEATLTGDVNAISEADGSASVRIVPLVNTITDLDLSQKETWFGKGTLSVSERDASWANLKRKIATVEQFGLIGFLASLIFVYACVIRRIISIETLCFVFLLLLSILNAYITWSMFFVFTTIRYFQIQEEQGCLCVEQSGDEDNSNIK